MTPNNYAIIMAGGIGQRFWPKGTSKLPKQFLAIEDDRESMIRKTYNRLLGIFKPVEIFVVTNIQYKNLVKKHLPNLPEENIICEPFGRNTAPCIGLACMYIQQFNHTANVLVVPSDHIINNVAEFQEIVLLGLHFVHQNGGIVTLGIHPIRPDTGYGYIQFDEEHQYKIKVGNREDIVYKVKTFAEKPNVETAQAFLDSGDFLWNSGMFIFRVDTMMAELKENLSEIYNTLIELEGELHAGDFEKKLELAYSKIKGISIDYGVMEKSSKVYTIKSHFDWSDVGSWDEIYKIKNKDKNGNVKIGRTVTLNTKNCLIINDQRITATYGVEDLLIIDTDNGLLVCKREESQNVKEIVDYLKRKGLDQFI
ncbi:MAG: mannose-1-phosphate guanylyltransferase [Ignavibacteria bacterium]